MDCGPKSEHVLLLLTYPVQYRWGLRRTPVPAAVRHNKIDRAHCCAAEPTASGEPIEHEDPSWY